jgi:hypothetical protein
MAMRTAQTFISRVIADARGTAVTEFAIVAPLFLAVFIGLLEISIQFYWAQAAEKAAQLGVRTAVVVTPAVALPATNDHSATGLWGQICAPAADPCAGFAPLTCTGAACVGGFNVILDRMQRVFPAIQAANITLRYEYVNMGFAGGPTVPAVTLTITGLNWPDGPFAAVIGLLGGAANATTLPTIRATLTGEDLAT